MSRIHTEGYPAGELKHGSIALIDPEIEYSTKFIVIILNDEYVEDMNLALREIGARKAYTIVITDCIEKVSVNNAHKILEIDSIG